METDSPDEKKEENSEDQADALIVTEDTSERALDHKVRLHWLILLLLLRQGRSFCVFQNTNNDLLYYY